MLFICYGGLEIDNVLLLIRKGKSWVSSSPSPTKLILLFSGRNSQWLICHRNHQNRKRWVAKQTRKRKQVKIDAAGSLATTPTMEWIIEVIYIFILIEVQTDKPTVVTHHLPIPYILFLSLSVRSSFLHCHLQFAICAHTQLLPFFFFIGRNASTSLYPKYVTEKQNNKEKTGGLLSL